MTGMGLGGVGVGSSALAIAILIAIEVQKKVMAVAGSGSQARMQGNEIRSLVSLALIGRERRIFVVDVLVLISGRDLAFYTNANTMCRQSVNRTNFHQVSNLRRSTERVQSSR
jgi:hypothetical protein